MWMYVLHMLASTPYISGLFMGGIQLDLHHQHINFATVLARTRHGQSGLKLRVMCLPRSGSLDYTR